MYKSFVIAALLGHITAVKLNDSEDCPNSSEVFSHNETSPAAAGFIQTSACHQYGTEGVSCLPKSMLFATGMNGDEDLGQDITMKGEKFHYNQSNLVQFATGMNGDEDLGQDITMKGEKFHYNQQ